MRLRNEERRVDGINNQQGSLAASAGVHSSFVQKIHQRWLQKWEELTACDKKAGVWWIDNVIGRLELGVLHGLCSIKDIHCGSPEKEFY